MEGIPNQAELRKQEMLKEVEDQLSDMDAEKIRDHITDGLLDLIPTAQPGEEGPSREEYERLAQRILESKTE